MAVLKLPYIEAKQKRFTILNGYTDTIDLSKRPDLIAALGEVRLNVMRGTELPDKFYRRDHLTTPDAMLDSYGMMHLHPGNPNTREVFVVVQTDDEIILIAITDHSPFESNPPGAVLRDRFADRIAQRELDKETERQTDVEHRNADIRGRLGLSKKTESMTTPTMRQIMDATEGKTIH